LHIHLLGKTKGYIQAQHVELTLDKPGKLGGKVSLRAEILETFLIDADVVQRH